MRKYSLILILFYLVVALKMKALRMAMGSSKAKMLVDKLKLSVLLITNKEDNNQVIKINFP